MICVLLFGLFGMGVNALTKEGRLRDLANKNPNQWKPRLETSMAEDGLLIFTDEYALTLYEAEGEKYDGTNFTGKGLRFFRLEDGIPKIKMAIWNSP